MPEVPDEAPLSPRSPRPAMAQMPVSEQPLESKGWPPGRNGMEEPQRPEPPPPRMPAAEPPKDQALFDVVWPAARPGAAPVAEPARREPAAAVAAAPSPQQRRSEPAQAPSANVAILKSGVIDGMAYTLYADGSIEAELPQGVIKFASIDALRSHLEKHG